ncbi:MAG: RtcB family protein [Treponema sp.]|nr:RtcB family protein [Treponema sp.]
MLQIHNQNQISDKLNYSISVAELPDFLQTVEQTNKSIIIQVTGEITYEIIEKIESVFLYNDFEQLDIHLDLSKVTWDSLYCINNWFVRSILLPDSVTDIDGSMIFSPTLKEILVSETNPKLTTIDGVLYKKDKSVLLRYPQAKKGSFVIPDTVIEIGQSAFENCPMLESVKVPYGVKSVGENAFRNCSSLNQIELPENSVFCENSFSENTRIIRTVKAELQISGQYNTAKVFSDTVDSDAYAQILEMMNQSWSSGLSVRIMPDVHAGRGCTVGTTMTIRNCVVPSLVGADIGCGVDVLVVKRDSIKSDRQDFLEKFDAIIHKQIASGREGRTKLHSFAISFDVKKIFAPVDAYDSKRFLGTLGGGNHFIEIDLDENENLYFVIHSGSRHLGKMVCDYHQKIAQSQSEDGALHGAQLNAYLHDMALAQHYANLNRKAMLDEIRNGLGIKKQDILDEFSTLHNYIDIKNQILRKGAISAQKGEKVIIPMNMRDGSLICTGKGNPDWNFSAPHGAGRLYKRGEAKELFSLEEYKKQMQGIFSSSIAASTIDESPMAYKPIETILEKITPTVKVDKIIKPIYNFKAGGQ